MALKKKVKKGSKKNKNSKKAKAPKAKKIRKTGGFPEQIAVTLERDEDDPDHPYMVIHPITFDDINTDSAVGIFRFRRVAQVNVLRKIKRVPKD